MFIQSCIHIENQLLNSALKLSLQAISLNFIGKLSLETFSRICIQTLYTQKSVAAGFIKTGTVLIYTKLFIICNAGLIYAKYLPNSLKNTLFLFQKKQGRIQSLFHGKTWNGKNIHLQTWNCFWNFIQTLVKRPVYL